MAQILQLDSQGQPQKWIGWQDAAFYHAKGLVAWELGEIERTIMGGTSAATGERSKIVTASIIAVKGEANKRKVRPPALSNRALFARDFNMCAYCGHVFSDGKLTRDHVTPRSRGGADTWNNCVTACGPCNQKKDDKTPEQAHMKLLYLPYTPSRAEHLILANRRIIADQMEFLLGFLPEDSRLKKRLLESGTSNLPTLH